MAHEDVLAAVPDAEVIAFDIPIGLPQWGTRRLADAEARKHASRYLDRVKRGETVEVSERGRLVALLVPPDPAVDARARLIADGRLIPAAAALRFPLRRVSPGNSANVLDALRDDR